MKIRTLAFAGLFVVSVAHATLVAEKFTTDPALAGWQAFGDTNLFTWDATNQNLAVTWDSLQPNSYFYHPLGAVLTRADEFLITFDLRMTDATAVGFFELGIGLCHFSDATSPGFARGTGTDSPNLAEFNYFPDSGEGFGSTISSTISDMNASLGFYEDLVGLAPGVTYHVLLIHRAGEEFMGGTVFTNGGVYSTLPARLSFVPLTDFQLDTVTISSYTSTNDPYGDSLLAHGTVDNFAVASPLPLHQLNTVAAGTIQFASDTNWLYTLEQSPDFTHWTPAAPASLGNGTNLVLQATNAPANQSFYRVRADLP
ncbi:MAG: hypothetical protein P4N60_04930 [Verrucomicrobiae bacterium]|nr:hypothetical protein [Verrucomicrobiae bacterium]